MADVTARRARQRAAFVSLLFCLPIQVQAQPWSGVLDPGRAVDWGRAGIAGGTPERATTCRVFNPGATGAQIGTALQSSECQNGVVFLDAGTYNLSDGIDFGGASNVTLRGAGADRTFLVLS